MSLFGVTLNPGGNSGFGGIPSSATGGSQSSSTGSFIPDYPQSEFLMGVAQYANQLAQAMLAWGQDLYNQTSDLTDQVVDAALVSSLQAGGLAANALARYQNQFQPLEDQLIRDANTYASDSRIAQNMGEAQAGAMQAGEAGLRNAVRDLESFGIDPSAGRYADLLAASRVQMGANAAAAGRRAQLDTEDRGRAMRSEAIRVGQQYPQQALSALQTGIQGLNTAQNAAISRVNAGTNLMSLPNQFLNTAANLRYPPLGQGPSSSFSFSGANPNNLGLGPNSVLAPPNKPGGQGEGGGQQERRPPQQRPPQQPGQGGPGQQPGGPGDSWAPPGKPQPFPDPAIMPISGGSPFTGLDQWDPLGLQQNPDQFNWWDNQAQQQPDLGWEGYDPAAWEGAASDWEGYDPAAWEGYDNTSTWDESGGWDMSDYSSGWDEGGFDYDYGSYDPWYDDAGSWDESGGWDMSGYDDYGGYDSSGWDESGGWDMGYSDYGDYGSWDTGGFEGDYYYAEGGPVPPPGGTQGGNVPRLASPSRGRRQDDVNAKLTADEFVIPRDVAIWKGQEFFQKLIEQSRKNRLGAPAKGKQGPAAQGRPDFVSRPGA